MQVTTCPKLYYFDYSREQLLEELREVIQQRDRAVQQMEFEIQQRDRAVQQRNLALQERAGERAILSDQKNKMCNSLKDMLQWDMETH